MEQKIDQNIPVVDSDHYIHKKIASGEVIKQIKKTRVVGVISIVGFVVVALLTKTYSWAGGISASILTFGIIGIIFLDLKKHIYLANKYGHEVPRFKSNELFDKDNSKDE